MTAPAPTRNCEHCKGHLVAKALSTTVPGTRAVTVALCKCDYLTCHSCDTTVYDRFARRCVCGRDPAVRPS